MKNMGTFGGEFQVENIQLSFNFESLQETKNQGADSIGLKRFDDPANENQVLFNLQYEYYNGNEEALVEMFKIMNRISSKLLVKEIKRKGVFYSWNEIQEKAFDAVTLYIEQVKKNNLVIEKSFVAYLYLQIRKVLYGSSERKSYAFEKFCAERKINIFDLPMSEREQLKKEYEKRRKQKCNGIL